MSNEKYQGKYNNGTYPPVRRTRRRRKNNTKKIVLVVALVLLVIVSAIALRSLQFGSSGVSITSHPKNATADVGETVNFSIKAKGDNLTYQWQWRENGSSKWAATTVEGNKTSTISVPAKVARHGYQYRCKITDSAGSVTYSDAAVLTIKSGPIITDQTESKTAVVGENVTFKVTATGNGLKYQWQWRKNDSVKWASTTVEGNKTASIKVPVTKERNGYQYRCVITDANNISITSDPVTLTVE